MNNVNRNTRAGKDGKRIICPSCKATSTVYHFAWSALTCNVCDADVQKNDWLILINKKAVKGRGWERDVEGRDSQEREYIWFVTDGQGNDMGTFVLESSAREYALKYGYSVNGQIKDKE
tara:strand:+ start:154 stop:510 length:357 start_codon:yes stop_codon:yes gene_type:complete